MQLSTSWRASAIWESAALTCSSTAAIWALRLSAAVRAWSRAWTLVKPSAARPSFRPSSRSALSEIDLEAGALRGGGVPLGPGGLQPPLRVRIVEPGQELPLGDGHPFVDVDVDDPGGDLGRDRGPAPRGDVAAGVQEGRGGRISRGARFGERDDGGPAAEPQEGPEDDGARDDGPGDETPGPPSHAGGADALVDPQP